MPVILQLLSQKHIQKKCIIQRKPRTKILSVALHYKGWLKCREQKWALRSAAQSLRYKSTAKQLINIYNESQITNQKRIYWRVLSAHSTLHMHSTGRFFVWFRSMDHRIQSTVFTKPTLESHIQALRPNKVPGLRHYWHHFRLKDGNPQRSSQFRSPKRTEPAQKYLSTNITAEYGVGEWFEP